MRLDSRCGSSPFDPRTVGMDGPDVLAAEAIESVESAEFAFRFGPARGILNALVIGAGLWTFIFAVVALTLAVFSA